MAGMGAKQASGHAPTTWVSTRASVNTQKAKVQSSDSHRGQEVKREQERTIEKDGVSKRLPESEASRD